MQITKSRTLPALLVAGLAAAHAQAATETVLTSFTVPNGYNPTGVALAGGVMYGTTGIGGTGTCNRNAGCGTIYSMTTSGQFNVLYSFADVADGNGPAGSLVDVGGTLYGVTQGGGKCSTKGGCGTFYSITPAGAKTTLYTFAGTTDGADPQNLINVNGKFFGIALGGGGGNCAGGCPLVFSLTAAGVEKVVYSFSSASIEPVALTNMGTKLYGTTKYGGTGSCGGNTCGTVFTLTPGGTYTNLYSFQGGSDGFMPSGNLVKVGQTIYGTTLAGGTGTNCSTPTVGCGTVFSITKAGTETALYSFQGGTDGAAPSSILRVGTKLYGTTNSGGSNVTCDAQTGCGTFFSLTRDGTEKVVYAFQGGSSDGALPIGTIVNTGGTFYGTTHFGGTDNIGTLYSLTP